MVQQRRRTREQTQPQPLMTPGPFYWPLPFLIITLYPITDYVRYKHMAPRKRAPSQTCDQCSASEVMDSLFTAFLGEHTSALRSPRGERVCTWKPVARLIRYGRLVPIARTIIPIESRHR